MILTKFLKIAMLRVVLDWQKIYETVLEKALSFRFWRFYLFLVLVSKNLKMALLRGEFFFLNRSYGVSKNREFYADFKMPNYLSDKMPLKKLKLKNEN